LDVSFIALMRPSGCGTRSIRPSRSRRLRLRVSVVWSMASMDSSCLRFASPRRAMVARMLNWVTRRPLGRRTSSYSCVTARLTMRSVLQTHGDSRSRSCPFLGLLFMAPYYSSRRRRASVLYAPTYYWRHRHSAPESIRLRPTSPKAGGAGFADAKPHRGHLHLGAVTAGWAQRDLGGMR